MNALDLPAALDACTADLKDDRLAALRVQHERERFEALQSSLEDDGDERAPTEVPVDCGCVAHLEEDCDGDTSWPVWRWADDACRVLGEEA